MAVQRSLVRSQIISTTVETISNPTATMIGLSFVQEPMFIGSRNVFDSGWTVATVLSSPMESNLLSYLELGEALTDLYNLSEDEHWKIEPSVYGASIQVAAALMEKNIPRPSIFTHGPKSVVFNWSSAERNLYLTITGSGVSVLISSRDGIEYRTEIASPQIQYTNYLLSALSLSPLSSPN